MIPSTLRALVACAASLLALAADMPSVSDDKARQCVIPDWDAVLQEEQAPRSPYDLKRLLTELLQAQCTCQYPSALRQRFVTGGEDWSILPADADLRCFGPMEVVALSVDRPSFVFLTLRATERGLRTIIFVILEFYEGRWFVTTPGPFLEGQGCAIPDWDAALENQEAPPSPRDLKWLLTEFFRAHCTCRFDADLRQRITVGGEGMALLPPEGQPRCLGQPAFEDLQVDSPDWVSLTFKTEVFGKPTTMYTILSFYEGRWLVYLSDPID